MEKLHLMALLNPGLRGLIVRKVRDTLGGTALVTWREFVAKEGLASGQVWFHGGSAEEAPQYRYDNGSKILLGGMDKPSKILSSELDLVYVQEATELTKEDWETITTRLRRGTASFNQLIADCNPDAPTHWLRQRANEGTTVLLESRHEENPVYFDDQGNMTPKGVDYIRGKLDKLTGVRYQRLRLGKWVAAEGMIFEDYDPAVHLIDRFDIPWSWPRYWVVDFGFTHPYVMTRWALDPDGRAYLYGEQHMTQRLVEDHARDTLSIVQDSGGRWLEPPPRAVICDHDAEDRATLERHLQLSTVAATKAVDGGIQLAQARLKRVGDGKPRVFFLRGGLYRRDRERAESGRPCATVEEFPSYVWATPAQTGTVAAAKERPVKDNDDGMDTFRYLCSELDAGVTPRVRWL
jgi:phage terminase large subunit